MTIPNAPEAATAAPAATLEDEFGSAFAALNPSEIANATTPTPAPAAEAAPAPAPEATPAPAAAAPTEADPNVPAPDPATPPAEATPVPDPATPTPAAAPAVSPEIAALQAEIDALKAAQTAPAPAAAETPTPAPAALYTPDEQTALAKYKEDWPDVARGEALQRRDEYVQLANYIFTQINARMAPLEDVASTQQTKTLYSEIKALEPDYDKLRDPTLAWIKLQPPLKQKVYQEVADTGTAEEVAELIGEYKTATGIKAAPAAATPSPAAPAAPAALPAAAAVAAQALKPVRSGRSEPTQGVDPMDFDGAFAEFSAAK